MIAFWAVAGALSAAAAGLILHRAAVAARTPPADPTLGLHRRQLAELDDLAARGLLAEDEIRGARAEAGRRLLAASDRPEPAWTAGPAFGRWAAVAAGAAAILAVVLYLMAGSPGASDQPFARRLAAWRGADPVTLDPQQMAAVLKAVTAERPADPEAWRYRALAQGAADDVDGAARSLRRALALAPQRADLWEMLGEALMAQTGGAVSPEAQAAFRAALARDPKTRAARFHLARARMEAGDRAGGLAELRALAAALPANDPDRAAVEEAMAQPAPLATVPDLGAIRGMVQGLAARLQARPDDPEGWVRLVRSYAVLGDSRSRDAALAQARARFAARRDVLADLEAAARTEPMR